MTNKDFYLVTELLPTDLQKILDAKKQLSITQIKYFCYQMLRALKYLHSAGVIHRDLKPSNILLNEKWDLKVCDFGLAKEADSNLTGYVCTRIYRAPELLLCQKEYDEKVDTWAVGCILAEMLLQRPLFPGKSHVHQLLLIMNLVSNVSELSNYCSEATINYIQFKEQKQSIQSVFGEFDNVTQDFLEGLLQFEAPKRFSATRALEHEWLQQFHDPNDEPVATLSFAS